MKIYIGERKPTFNSVTFTNSEDDELTHKPLPMRLDLFNHSPDGFDWGYAGSGPSQLSLALLADALKDEKKALRFYQAFKFRAVARFPKTLFVISDKEIVDIVRDLESEESS